MSQARGWCHKCGRAMLWDHLGQRMVHQDSGMVQCQQTPEKGTR